MRKIGFLTILTIIVFASILISSGCGKKEEKEIVAPNNQTTESQEITIPNNPPTANATDVTMPNNQSTTSGIDITGPNNPSTETQPFTMTMNTGGSQSEISIGTNDFQELIPEDFPFPDDHQMITDQSGSITTGASTQINMNYATNVKEEDILEMYKKYLKDKGNYTITEIPDPPSIMAISEKGLTSIGLVKSEQSGYSTNVTIIIQATE